MTGRPESEAVAGEPRPRPALLIVDDSPTIVEGLKDFLEKHFDVATAGCGREAWEAFERSVPDLVLLDMVLPDTSGREICQRMRTDPRLRDVPVIFVTSISDPDEIAASISEGAVDYITKPVRLPELLARIRLHLGLKESREALARQNLLLEEVVRERTEKLEQILSMALALNSERDPDRLFNRIVAGISVILDCDRTSLFLVDADRRQLWTRFAEGVAGTMTVPIGTGVVGKTAAVGVPRVIADTANEPDFDSSWDARNNYRTRNILCFPVMNRNAELMGVLEAINKRDGVFDAGDMELAAALAAQAGVALETDNLFQELKGAFESFARTLSRAVEAKHPLTAGHAIRVTEYSLLLGRRIGLSATELEVLKYAGLLHDIGKIGVPDCVLTKRGQFDPDEKKLMQGHAKWTGLILNEIQVPKNLREVPRIATCHHERIDGRGYPAGLPGEQIPFLSKIIAVCDVFDALTSRRDYSKYDGDVTFTFDPLSFDKAFEILDRDKGTQFDTDVVAAALGARGELVAHCESQAACAAGLPQAPAAR